MKTLIEKAMEIAKSVTFGEKSFYAWEKVQRGEKVIVGLYENGRFESVIATFPTTDGELSVKDQSLFRLLLAALRFRMNLVAKSTRVGKPVKPNGYSCDRVGRMAQLRPEGMSARKAKMALWKAISAHPRGGLTENLVKEIFA